MFTETYQEIKTRQQEYHRQAARERLAAVVRGQGQKSRKKISLHLKQAAAQLITSLF